MTTALRCNEVVFRQPRFAAFLIWLGVVMLMLVLPVVGIFTGWVGALAALGAAILCWTQAARVQRRRRLGGTVSFEPYGLRVLESGGETHDVRFEAVESGYVAPGAAVLHLRNGTQLSLRLDGDGPSRVLAHAGVGPAQRALSVPLRRMLGAFTIGFVSFWPLLIGWLALSGAMFRSDEGLLFALLMAAISTALVVGRFGFPRVVVGTDGIRVLGVLPARFIPHEAIAGVEVVPSAYPNTAPSIRVLLHREAPLALPTIAAPTERIEGLAHRIREAALTHASGGARRLDALARGSRTVQEWRDDVARIALAPPGFRAQSLGREDFEHALADAAAPPDQRIGAALALRALDPSGAPARIRVVADASADDALREVLALASEGEIDDALLVRASARKASR